MKIKIVIFILLFLIFSTFSFATEKKDYVLYYVTTAESITVSWDSALNSIKYKIYLYHYERKELILIGETAGLSYTFILPRTGHYIIKITSNNSSGEESAPCQSIDSDCATVDGDLRAWWLYGHIAPPGIISITSENNK